jgi:hypothetical protein
VLKLVYRQIGEKVECQVMIFRNKEKVDVLKLSTTTGKLAGDIVEAVEQRVGK